MAIYRACHAFQLRQAKIFQQPRRGVEGPVERTHAALAAARVDPVDQFLVGELAGVALTVIDVSTIDLAVPKDALRRGQARGREPREVLLAPRVAAGEIVDALAEARLLVAAVTEGDDRLGIGG